MRARLIRAAAGVALVAGSILSACTDPFRLQAFVPNAIDTAVVLWAASDTLIHLPSGYNVQDGSTVRTDRFADIDFLFDIDSAGQAVLLPTGAIGLGRGSGIFVTAEPFAAIRLAPTTGYQDSLPVAVDSGTVAVIRSRPLSCSQFITLVLPYYAKLEVLELNALERRLKFRILIDANCGFRGLEEGLPTR